MSRDDSRMGKPSAWASDMPATTPAIVHRHPLTRSVRVLLIVYGLMLGLSFGGVLWIIVSNQHQSAQDRQAIVNRVEADIKKAQAEGLARDAANNEKMRQTVCVVIKESLKPTPSTRELARQLHCGTLVTPSPTPAPSAEAAPAPRVTVYVYDPASGSETQASSAPRSSPSSSSPAATHSPSPSPSPSRRCLIPRPAPLPPCQRRQST